MSQERCSQILQAAEFLDTPTLPVRRPVFGEFDQRVFGFIELVAGSSPDVRECIAERIKPRMADKLIGFSVRMSIHAVRAHSLAAVRAGLMALLLVDKSEDADDGFFALPRLHRSAVLIGEDPRKAFHEVAEMRPNARLASSLREFPDSSPEHRSLEFWRIGERGEGENFEYYDVGSERLWAMFGRPKQLS